MSLLIPRRSIDALRKSIDVVLSCYGIPCTLYIPDLSSYNAAEVLDVYSTPQDYTHTQYTTNVYPEWKPSLHRIKQLGIYAEGESPMIAWFGRTAVNQAGATVDVSISIRSYFEIETEMMPENTNVNNQFEIVDVLPYKFHDAVIKQGFVIAPRRVEI
jgi:hypothetical protein